MPDRDSILAQLRHAAACYGEDLALDCHPGSRAVAPPPETGADRTPGVALEATPPETTAPVTDQPEAKQPVAAPPGAARPEASPTQAEELRALAEEVAPCTKCKLHQGRTHLVFGEGSPEARVMFVGEAPGQVEDETGRPFVGRSGQLLDKIIENAMGMQRSDVFIANINKCRPPGNRDPEPDEIAACLPWLRSQVAIIRPEVIVTLGRVALWNLLSVTEPMGRMRGRELYYEGIPVVPTWHPAYLLRTPKAKAQTWEDIKRVNRILGHPEIPEES